MSNGAQETAGAADIVSARRLLIRTAELPDSNGELLAVLGEYRRALHALVVGSGSPETAPEPGQRRSVRDAGQ